MKKFISLIIVVLTTTVILAQEKFEYGMRLHGQAAWLIEDIITPGDYVLDVARDNVSMFFYQVSRDSMLYTYWEFVFDTTVKQKDRYLRLIETSVVSESTDTGGATRTVSTYILNRGNRKIQGIISVIDKGPFSEISIWDFKEGVIRTFNEIVLLQEFDQYEEDSFRVELEHAKK